MLLKRLRNFKVRNHIGQKIASPYGDESIFIRRSISSGTNPFRNEDNESLGLVRDFFQARKRALVDKFWSANSKYEEFIGLTDVQEAQQRVKQAETEFTAARARERAILREMLDTREKLKEIRERLSHVDYSNTMYLQLASDQHELVNKETNQKRELEEIEDEERDAFLELSTSMRESYEHERARVERTKNWSIIGTVIGAVVGMVGAVYMNRVRTKELLKAVKETGNQSNLEDKLDSLTNELAGKQTATVNALVTVSENLSEMGSALQVQNLQVMAGFVDDAMNEREKVPQVGQKAPSHLSIPISSMKDLTEEISNYNTALNSLVKAISALTVSTSGQISDSGNATDVETLLREQITLFSNLQKQIGNISSSAERAELSTLSSRLDAIDRKLSPFSGTKANFDKTGPVIRELPPDFEPVEPTWSVGLKDAVLWGSILCCLYMFIKF